MSTKFLQVFAQRDKRATYQGHADPIFGEPDIAVASDILGFAGIEPPTLRLYPLETHIAEKLHAFTLPRKRPNPPPHGQRPTHAWSRRTS